MWHGIPPTPPHGHWDDNPDVNRADTRSVGASMSLLVVKPPKYFRTFGKEQLLQSHSHRHPAPAPPQAHQDLLGPSDPKVNAWDSDWLASSVLKYF